jgi:hypothetical protein
VNDLYANKLCLYDLSPDNFLTHFEHSTQLLARRKSSVGMKSEQSDVPIEKLNKQRSNTINLADTEQINSLMHILYDRKMSIKLMSFGLKNKYSLKDNLMMAPESVLCKDS